MLEKIEGYYLRRNGKYLTSLKKWSKNIDKAMEFRTEKEIRAFQYNNKRIRAIPIVIIHQHILSVIGERTIVEFNQLEKKL